MDAEGRFPPISSDIVNALSRRFPERCPDPSWSDREVWRRVGQREVVRFLIAALAKQTENILEDMSIVHQDE